jgi:hypothetical protein
VSSEQATPHKVGISSCKTQGLLRNGGEGLMHARLKADTWRAVSEAKAGKSCDKKMVWRAWNLGGQ